MFSITYPSHLCVRILAGTCEKAIELVDTDSMLMVLLRCTFVPEITHRKVLEVFLYHWKLENSPYDIFQWQCNLKKHNQTNKQIHDLSITLKVLFLYILYIISINVNNTILACLFWRISWANCDYKFVVVIVIIAQKL